MEIPGPCSSFIVKPVCLASDGRAVGAGQKKGPFVQLQRASPGRWNHKVAFIDRAIQRADLDSVQWLQRKTAIHLELYLRQGHGAEPQAGCSSNVRSSGFARVQKGLFRDLVG